MTEELLEVAGLPLEPERLYEIVIDNFLMHNDQVLKAYSQAHPEHVPDEEQGRPALPMLVQYFCDRVWRSLCDLDADGAVQTEEVDEFFDLADTDGNGEPLGAVKGCLSGAAFELGKVKKVAESGVMCLDVPSDAGSTWTRSWWPCL